MIAVALLLPNPKLFILVLYSIDILHVLFATAGKRHIPNEQIEESLFAWWNFGVSDAFLSGSERRAIPHHKTRRTEQKSAIRIPCDKKAGPFLI